jgi:hypothetical protein
MYLILANTLGNTAILQEGTDFVAMCKLAVIVEEDLSEYWNLTCTKTQIHFKPNVYKTELAHSTNGKMYDLYISKEAPGQNSLLADVINA